jgi:putative ABC transport system permease protein
MLKNYVIVALRNFWKNKVYSSINVLGFSIGLACAFMIGIYVYKELSYDRYHTQAERIYRITETIQTDGVGEASASVPIPVGPTLKEDFPHLIKASARFFNFSAPSLALEYTPEKRFNEQRLFFTDQDVFAVFDFTMLEGNKHTSLIEPNSIVLTETMARKYFGTEQALGKTLRFEDRHDLKVTGVLADVPATSHFVFDFLVSFNTLNTILHETQRTGWFWNPAYTYLLLADNTTRTRETLEQQLPGFVAKYFPEIIKKGTQLGLQALTNIYLCSRFDYEIQPVSNMLYVYIFSLIGMFILIIASINFMNLTTARSANRAKEVGVRKVLGSQKKQLIIQFLSEATFLSVVALTLALGIVAVSIPLLNRFSGKDLSLGQAELSLFLPAGLLIALFVGLLSGVYPAFYISAFSPLRVLKGFSATKSGKGVVLRKSLVVLQFSLSILLIVGTMVAYFQLQHLQNASLGFNKEQVLIVPITRSKLSTIEDYESFKKRLLQNSRIRSITAMEEVIGKGHNTGSYRPEGKTEDLLMSRLFVRHDFTQTFDIPILAGRGFSEEFKSSPNTRYVMINEALVKYMGWESPEAAVGKRMAEFRRDTVVFTTRVAGVVKDFHITSLHQDIKPLVLEGPPTNNSQNQFFIKFMAVKVAPGQVSDVIAFIEKEWNSTVTDRAFEYSFLDESLNRQYQAEVKFGGVSLVFTLLAIFVACLGLFGLATFTAQQRTKEIGIRKVLGASVSSITLLLSVDFLRLVLLSVVIASPVAYYAMYRWLESFAYRIAIPWWVFLAAGIVALTVAIVTISYQSIKAALSNPVKSLRNE